MTIRENTLLHTYLTNKEYSVIYKLGDEEADCYAAMFFTGNKYGEDFYILYALKEGYILDVFFKMRRAKNKKLGKL